MPKISKGDGMCQRGGGTIYGEKECEREVISVTMHTYMM